MVIGHVLNKAVIEHFNKVNSDCTGQYDVFYLADNTNGLFEAYESNDQFHLFALPQLESLGYTGKTNRASKVDPRDSQERYHKKRSFVMGNTELPLLKFFKENPDYSYYWVVEYDVYYTGSWRTLFSHFEDSSSDLLATSLIEHEHVKEWFRWESMRLSNQNIARSEYIRGFFPIYRISQRALYQLDEDYKSGVSGHYECLMPTLLNHRGYKLEDIGGDGEFVEKQNYNRFYTNHPRSEYYTPGTFVFRPPFYRPGNQPNTLWHPVKYEPLFKAVFYKFRRAIKMILVKAGLFAS